MNTEYRKTLGSFTEAELRECLIASLKRDNDLMVHGQSSVDAESPLGRLLSAQEADKAASAADVERQAQGKSGACHAIEGEASQGLDQ